MLRAGDLVVFPTETVYGLGANASDPAAVRKIFQVKGRPTDHPVIVHLDNPRYLHRWVSNMPAAAEKLAARFWPGPLTVILPKAEKVNDIVTGGRSFRPGDPLKGGRKHKNRGKKRHCRTVAPTCGRCAVCW